MNMYICCIYFLLGFKSSTSLVFKRSQLHQENERRRGEIPGVIAALLDGRGLNVFRAQHTALEDSQSDG